MSKLNITGEKVAFGVVGVAVIWWLWGRGKTNVIKTIYQTVDETLAPGTYYEKTADGCYKYSYVQKHKGVSDAADPGFDPGVKVDDSFCFNGDDLPDLLNPDTWT